MSFWVYLESEGCKHCGCTGHTRMEFNLTHNVNGIVDACLVAGGATTGRRPDASYPDRSWGRLNGWTAPEVRPILEVALATAKDPARAAEFRAMEPDNKWGTLAVTTEMLDRLLVAVTEPESAHMKIRTSG